MADIVRKQEITLVNLDNTITIVSGGKNELTLKKIPVHVLEMEDVCFHDGSALLLLEAPIGSNEGSTSDQNQKKVSGAASLALVFRQFQEAPDKKLLIAGHDDSNGAAKQGFSISKLRAEGILYLLIGDKAAWAAHAAANHTIKDYQQFLKTYHYIRGCDCDPGEINGVWGAKTEAAVKAFFDVVNKSGQIKSLFDIEQVRKSPNKLWPLKVWEEIYSIYEENIFSILIGASWTPDDAVRERKRLSFVDSSKPYVACGESFPIDKIGTDNYRSQKNRRVEFLFFDKNELPPLPIKCPAVNDRNHTEKECPLYKDAFYRRAYIKPDDINTAVYHLRFVYFNKIINEWKDVPDGIEIRAFKAGKQVLSTCRGLNGVYKVRVLNIPGGKREKDVSFAFETKSAFVYTKDKNTAPEIIYTFDDKAKTPVTQEALAKKPLAERMHYYDLPQKWDSVNWLCSLDDKQDLFSEQVQNVTQVTAPLTFNLDSIVLMKPGKTPGLLTQEIKDCDHFDSPKAIDPAKSRYKILYIDKTTGNLELYKSGAELSTSRIPFERNFIISPVNNTVIILFGNDFYTIGSKRTFPENLPNQIVGARAAVMDAPGVHLKQTCLFNSSNNDTEFGYTGDYELHYFHHLCLNSNQPTSYMIVFTSVAFMRDSRYPDVPAANSPPGKMEVKKFVDDGVYHAMEYWNKKRYFFTEEPETADSTCIRLFYFVDERETFEVPDADRPTNIDFDQKPLDLMKDNAVKTAREKAFGAKSKFLALIVNEDAAWQWSRRNDKVGGATLEYSLFKLNKEAHKGIASPWAIPNVSENGFVFKYFTFAHELGHALGLPDEYINRRGLFPGGDRFPFRDQYFEPYCMEANEGSMMYHNFAPRLHTTWYYLHRLNSCIAVPGGSDSFEKLINTLLPKKKFKARYVNGTNNFTYDWALDGDNATHKNMRKPCYLEQKSLIPGTVGKSVYLALHNVGQDESSERNFYNGQKVSYQKVLMVRIVFTYVFPATVFWTNNEKKLRLADIMKYFHSIRDKYYLKNVAKPSERIFVHFLIAIENAGLSNYNLSFTDATTISKEPVSVAPAALPAGSPLNGIFSYNAFSKEACYTGRMVDAHVPLIQNLFAQVPDKNAIIRLRDKTRSLARISNAGGTLTINKDITMEEVVKYCLNIGADELSSLTYLKSLVDGKTGVNYTLEKIV